jgi:hypothetical protein
LLIEADTDKSDQFALIDAYLQRIVDTDKGSVCSISTNDGCFEAAAIAPAATINACQFLYCFVCLDGCHTSSKYHMMLLIAVGIDANSNILPLAWAVVPTENDEWWLWFLEFLKETFDQLSKEDFIFMSDREKGISSSISTVFLSAFQGKCCQHIADNVQQRYGIKYKLLFWKCAYSRTHTHFKVFLPLFKARSIGIC